MRVTLTEDEASDTRVAIRMAEAAFTQLVSMCATKEGRGNLMAVLARLHRVDQKLGGEWTSRTS